MLRFKDISAVTKIEAMWEYRALDPNYPAFTGDVFCAKIYVSRNQGFQ